MEQKIEQYENNNAKLEYKIQNNGSFGKFMDKTLVNPLKTDMDVMYKIFRLLDAFEDCPCGNGVTQKLKTYALNAINSYVQNLDNNSISNNGEFSKLLEQRDTALSNTIYKSDDWYALMNMEGILNNYELITQNTDKRQALNTSISKIADGMIKFLPHDDKPYDKIITFDQFDEYCLIVGGHTGSMITDLLLFNEVVDKETYLQLNDGINVKNHLYTLSEATGIFVQYANMVRDAKEDFEAKKHCLPINPNESQILSVEHIENALEESIPFFDAAINYYSLLPNNQGINLFISTMIEVYSERLLYFANEPTKAIYSNDFKELKQQEKNAGKKRFIVEKATQKLPFNLSKKFAINSWENKKDELEKLVT